MARQLLPDGYTVRFYHKRRFGDIVDDHTCYTVLMPTGGCTICTIFDAQKEAVATGVARCRSDEHYVKRIGRGFSYSRALAALHDILNPPTPAERDEAERLAEQARAAAQIEADKDFEQIVRPPVVPSNRPRTMPAGDPTGYDSGGSFGM